MRILITGASRGIGAATARGLSGPGTDLLLHAHTHLSEARELAAELAAAGTRSTVLAADLAREDEVDRLAAEVASGGPMLDAVVHNAGTYPRVSFESMSDAEFTECLAANLLGPARLTRRLLPLLRRASRGRIVFVSSVLAFTGSAHGAHYAAAKAGIVGLARSLARELAPSITVNVVAPGAIDTAILGGDTPAQRAERSARIPLGRVGTPEEVAAGIVYLLSPGASYITGTVLHVNGGAFLG